MSFSAQIAKFSANTQTNLHRIRKGVCIKLFSAVIMDTPVLTGRLRGNWRFVEGDEPNLATDGREDPSGSIELAEIQVGVDASDGTKPLFFSNALPYAARIEFDGYSDKAPAGMMRKNVLRFNQLLTVEASK